MSRKKIFLFNFLIIKGRMFHVMATKKIPEVFSFPFFSVKECLYFSYIQSNIRQRPSLSIVDHLHPPRRTVRCCYPHKILPSYQFCLESAFYLKMVFQKIFLYVRKFVWLDKRFWIHSIHTRKNKIDVLSAFSYSLWNTDRYSIRITFAGQILRMQCASQGQV